MKSRFSLFHTYIFSVIITTIRYLPTLVAASSLALFLPSDVAISVGVVATVAVFLA